MEENSSYIELAYNSIPVFANDGTIDNEELNFLLGMALRDSRIDSDEKRVLKSIFSKVDQKDVSPKVWARIEELKRVHGL